MKSMSELSVREQYEGDCRESFEPCLICRESISKRYFVFGNSSSIERCLHCGTESIRPLPLPSQIREYYTNYPPTRTSEKDVAHLAQLSERALQFYLRKMDLRAKLARDLSFLEVGFGNGASLRAAAKLNLNAYGIDLDPKNIADMEAYSRAHGVPVSCRQGGVEEIQRFGMMFDIVKVSQVIEHVLNPVEFLLKIASAQLPGAYLIVDCPNNAAAFWMIKNRLRKFYDRGNYYNALKLHEHLWGFTEKSLCCLLKNSGYEIIFCHDFMMGSEIFQPESSLWYPTLSPGMRATISTRTPYNFLKACIRAFDSVASACFGRGMGLVALGKKTASH